MSTENTTPAPAAPFAHLYEKAYRAYTGTSFSPERRAASVVRDYSAEALQDIEDLKAQGITDTEVLANYMERYERLLTGWLYAKSNCISSMIAGPSNFPVRRAQKANRSEERHYELFRVWRDKALKAIVRRSLPAKTYLTELEKYEADLKNREAMQELMKSGNAIIRKHKVKLDDPASIEAGYQALVASGMSEKLARAAVGPDYGGRVMGFASWQLTNNLANIKRIKERIAILSAKEEQRNTATEEATTWAGPAGETVSVDYEADRIRIQHPAKPGPEVIQQLKRNGFKWAPSVGCWQRQITVNAVWAVQQVTGLKIAVKC